MSAPLDPMRAAQASMRAPRSSAFMPRPQWRRGRRLRGRARRASRAHARKETADRAEPRRRGIDRCGIRKPGRTIEPAPMPRRGSPIPRSTASPARSPRPVRRSPTMRGRSRLLSRRRTRSARRASGGRARSGARLGGGGFRRKFRVAEGVISSSSRRARGRPTGGAGMPSRPVRDGGAAQSDEPFRLRAYRAELCARRAQPEEAWRIAHVDEDFQIARWGEDEEAKARREARWRDFEAAAKTLAGI